MKPMAMLAVVAALALWIGGPADAGERAKADVRCQQTKTDLVYDCTIMLVGRKSGQPLVGAELVIKAEMPSMAMAHNVRPVAATAGAMPGHYKATLALEMYGEWVLILDVSGPTRDRIIAKLQFGKIMAHGKGEMKNMKPAD